MRPPGHSGKAKRGHLCFDSSFETGKNCFTTLKIGLFVKPFFLIPDYCMHHFGIGANPDFMSI
jgi:hypothetical protein